MAAAVLIIILALTVLLLLWLLLRQRRDCRRLRQQVAQLAMQLQESQRPAESFAEDLILAERKIQQPKVKPAQESAERYRLISGMARQGMNAAQIAKVLTVSEAEAEQIVRLAQLKRDV